MKLEKDRLIAKVENLESNYKQIHILILDNQDLEKKEKEDIQRRLDTQKNKKEEKSMLKPKGTMT